MKIRKRMGFPKAPASSLRRRQDAAKQAVPVDIVEMLRDQVRRTVVREQQLVAKQGRLLERALTGTPARSPREAQHKEALADAATTPEKLVARLNRMART